MDSLMLREQRSSRRPPTTSMSMRWDCPSNTSNTMSQQQVETSSVGSGWHYQNLVDIVRNSCRQVPPYLWQAFNYAYIVRSSACSIAVDYFLKNSLLSQSSSQRGSSASKAFLRSYWKVGKSCCMANAQKVWSVMHLLPSCWKSLRSPNRLAASTSVVFLSSMHLSRNSKLSSVITGLSDTFPLRNPRNCQYYWQQASRVSNTWVSMKQTVRFRQMRSLSLTQTINRRSLVRMSSEWLRPRNVRRAGQQLLWILYRVVNSCQALAMLPCGEQFRALMSRMQ